MAAANVASERPWSDKYRPQTLDEVASHADIIQTSARPPPPPRVAPPDRRARRQ